MANVVRQMVEANDLSAVATVLKGRAENTRASCCEAIEIKKMLIFDQSISCMKPDLRVSIIIDAINYRDKSKSKTKNMNLRRVFQAQLADYLKAHPEGGEIPEEDLPQPFKRSK